MHRAIEDSFVVRRLALRAGVWRPRTLRREAPTVPVGAKLELLYACNLRCGFCYTDSPRHTLARTPALADEEWIAIADEAVELGVVEAVLTGGEPLMRADLVLMLAERLSGAGVGVTLNTNGWFLDDDLADRLAAVPGLSVNVSIDGAGPEFHDAERGVPGSWRRAIEAVDRLLARGIAHQVVSVVTPRNADAVDDFLEGMWTLGVRSVRITPVAEIGAAARAGSWRVSRDRIRRTVRRFQRRTDGAMQILVQQGNASLLAVRDQAAPAAFLVRPNGAVLSDSLQPFAFGNARRDGLAECWRRIRDGWGDPTISAWAGDIQRSSGVREASVVPYLDDEVDLSAGQQPRAEPTPAHAVDPVPRPVAAGNGNAAHASGAGEARGLIMGLSRARRYKLGDVRIAGGSRELYVRHRVDGRVLRLNGTAGILARELDNATVSEAADRLADRYPAIDRRRLDADLLTGVRALVDAGVVRPALATGAGRALAPGSPDLPDVQPGSTL
jgi:MoaA/NifB/PqqE/SkfB family radical SAM enzyme